MAAPSPAAIVAGSPPHPGCSNFPATDFPQSLVNRGAIAGVYNVRNVAEFETVAITGFTFRRVTFDADVGLDHRVKVVSNGTASADTDASGNPVTLVPANRAHRLMCS